MARRKTMEEQDDINIDTSHALGRIEGKLDSVQGRLDRFDDTIKSHEEADTRRFDEVLRANGDRFDKLTGKIDGIITTQNQITGGWKTLTMIITAAAAVGGIVAEVISWLATHVK
jgi:predicted nuclease with TOPRIM domain